MKMASFSAMVENTYSYHLDLFVKYKNINEEINTAFLAIKMLLITQYIWKVSTNATF